jgi:hypothetical protein
VTIKICATCIHLKVLDQGREFDLILDTEYTLFECEKLNQRTKEFYLMVPVNDCLELNEPESICSYWEPWKREK